jgi:3-oxoacyl-[acyl-carrier-protein] synthase-3
MASRWHWQEHLSLKQDAGLGNQEIVKVAVDWALAAVIEAGTAGGRRGLVSSHYSSDYFRKSSPRPWTPSASAFPPSAGSRTWPGKEYRIGLDLRHPGGAVSSENSREGQKLLCFIPESGRFSIAYMMLTVV